MKKYEQPALEVILFEDEIMADVDLSLVTDINGIEDGGDVISN